MSDAISDAQIAELIARGAFDPDAPEADRHLNALHVAFRHGATVDDIVQTGSDLGVLIARLRLRGPGRYTLAEVAERARLSLDDALRISLAAGFTDADSEAATLTDNDVELLELYAAAREFFGEEVVLQLTRVIGASAARLADAFVSGFITTYTTQTAGEYEQEDLDRANETVIELLPNATRALELSLKRHLALRSRTYMPTPEEWEGVDTVVRAVGFCDVVGYTALSGNVSAAGLAKILETFEAAASDLITRRRGHVVKLIGDEVMFVASDAQSVCDIAIELVERFAAHPEVPAVRLGVAEGRVITREGDYFGPTVNLAARIVKLAPEGGIMAPASFRSVEGFTLEDAGSAELKGFHDPVDLILVRR